MVGLECEYGSNPSPDCDRTYDCTSAGWSTPAPVDCVSGTCPATYKDVDQGKACTPMGLACSYAEGQCNCSNQPIAAPSPIWQCSTPVAGCPEPRPDIGTACTQPGLQCDYGACTGGAAEECTDGYWQQAAVGCPG